MATDVAKNDFEIRLLTNFLCSEEFHDESTDESEFFRGNYEKTIIENEEIVQTILNSETPKGFKETLNEVIQNQTIPYKTWFQLAIESLIQFIRANWTGPQSTRNHFPLLADRITGEALKKLSLNDECNANAKEMYLLMFSKTILSNDNLQVQFPSSIWWLLRSNLIHQNILEEPSSILFEESEALIDKAENNLDYLLKIPLLKTIFHLEACHLYFYYRRVQISEKHLEIARNTAGLKLRLEGAMGKRTQYQQDAKAQLFLNIEMDKELFPSTPSPSLPKSVEINDDLRLEKIEFCESKARLPLGAVEEAIILAIFFQLTLAQPKDALTDEETLTYLNCTIEDTRNWSLRTSALYQRCLIEKSHKRTIERSLSQIEHLIHETDNKNPDLPYRVDLFFASGMKPKWMFRETLADLMLDLGMTKGALEIYTDLQLWESMIVCYTILELKHKSAEIIRQELEKKPTVKLWCLLGDAEDETKHYEAAWKLSNERSSRAQKHWGFHYFYKKKYEEAIPHLKLSVELNNIQENVWLRLGYAALQMEDWKLAASAYKRYSALEQTNFEAWNNLAKAYTKLGDKVAAWKSLQDAIKCNFDRWEVWDNFMVVSIDLGHFGEVIRSYHRLLDLRGQHVDTEILNILSKAIISESIKDSDGNLARKYLQSALQLFGRLTASIPNNSEIWRMYAELTVLKKTNLDDQKAAQYLQRAHRAAVADPRWFQTVTGTQNVLCLCNQLGKAYLQCSSNCDPTQKKSMLGSAKLALQGIIKKVEEHWKENEEILNDLKDVKDKFECIVNSLEEIKNSPPA